VGFVLHKVTLEQVFSKYLGNSHSTKCPHAHPSPGVGTTGQLVAEVPCRLSPDPTKLKRKNKLNVNSNEDATIMSQIIPLFNNVVLTIKFYIQRPQFVDTVSSRM
jgi:hypothetical protein